MLARFLAEAAAQPFELGSWDCATTPANWCVIARGVDPAATTRGTYSTDFGWARLAVAAGGLIPLWDGLCRGVGIERADRPLAGDIGIVEVPDFGLFGAICAVSAPSRRRWAVKMKHGLVGAPFAPVAVWRI